MLRRIQRLLSFKISQFKVATQVMKQTQNEEWRQKLPNQAKQKLEKLYRQAIEGYKEQTPYYGIQNDENEVEFWGRHMGQSKQRAESDYINFVHDILYYHNPEKCLEFQKEH